ncbi:cleavage stimulating factor 64-like isoform X1 [Nicotiana tomentosiformis]|uniref:cleavage stimulating factor 64-like isoform X1 n=2 Tax=Nicotiana tomentosiformis TaxID=4098 RepID=UPI00051C2717|nr:cleavage stimulating factor 64-like [Nicotiana tomentosiformis]
MAADGLSAKMAGMSKNQLYDIMFQMKTLVEQNQQQARQILIQNPSLTRALFQAQIMLGMVQPPQAIPAIQPTGALNPQQSVSQLPQSNVQTTPSLSEQIGIQEQTRKQQQNQPSLTAPSASRPPSNLQPPSLPSHPLQSVQQPKRHIGAQATPISLPQTSQIPNMPSLPHHSASPLPSHLQSKMPPASSQLEQPMQTSGNQHLIMQPQLPPQVRPPMQPFPHQVHLHMGPNVGFSQSGATQHHHHSQPAYHPALRPPASMGPAFLPGQPPVPSQLPPQSLYQMGGSHLRPEFHQVGSSMQADRVSPRIPSLPENTSGTHLPGPPPFPVQMGPSNQPSRPTALSPEMENALLQQVRSLTPEQINMLPPEQRNQVLQLQQMLG